MSSTALMPHLSHIDENANVRRVLEHDERHCQSCGEVFKLYKGLAIMGGKIACEDCVFKSRADLSSRRQRQRATGFIKL